MKRSYLIDSENINEVWVDLLEALEDGDEILVFYTDKSTHMCYERIVRLLEQKKGSLKWIKCFGGPNALDFQLVTELGWQLSREPETEYVIVSNDTGYDVVVRYWTQRGFHARRIRGTECETMAAQLRREEAKARKAGEAAEVEQETEAAQEAEVQACAGEPCEMAVSCDAAVSCGTLEEKAEIGQCGSEAAVVKAEVETESEFESEQCGCGAAVPETESVQHAASVHEVVACAEPEPETAPLAWNERMVRVFSESGSADTDGDMAFLAALCKTVRLSNLALMHNVLEYQFGQRVGSELYQIVKSDSACRTALAAGYISSKRQREKEYVSLLLKRNGMGDADVDTILRILNALPKKNLNSIHTGLVKRFGQEQGGRYYALLRRHVRIIRGL